MTAAATDAGVPDRTTRLVAIAHPRDDIEAQLITNLLADAGIEAMVTGGSLAGFRAEAPANVCVVVRSGDAEAAREAALAAAAARAASPAAAPSSATCAASAAASAASCAVRGRLLARSSS